MTDQNTDPITNNGQQTTGSASAKTATGKQSGGAITGSGFAPLPDESAQQTGSQSTGTPLADTGKRTIAVSKEDLEKFGIAEKFVKENPALVDLILKTESMKDKERKYWFQLLPIMTTEQVQKLQGILQNERDQLATLDAKYETEIKKLNDKHLLEWKEHEAKEKREKLESAEKESETKEKNAEQDILDQLEDL